MRRRAITDLLEPSTCPASAMSTSRRCHAHAAAAVPRPCARPRSAGAVARRAGVQADPRARVELRELLRELRVMGKTIPISSHILPELEELRTSVAIIDRGQVLRRAASPRSRSDCSGPSCASVCCSPRARPSRRRAIIGGGRRREVRRAARRRHDRARFPRRRRAATARLLASAVAAGLPVVSFAGSELHLEELFLQVTADEPSRRRTTDAAA